MVSYIFFEAAILRNHEVVIDGQRGNTHQDIEDAYESRDEARFQTFK